MTCRGEWSGIGWRESWDSSCSLGGWIGGVRGEGGDGDVPPNCPVDFLGDFTNVAWPSYLQVVEIQISNHSFKLSKTSKMPKSVCSR